MIPSEMAPWPGSPPIQNAPSISSPRNTENAGIHQRVR